MAQTEARSEYVRDAMSGNRLTSDGRTRRDCPLTGAWRCTLYDDDFELYPWEARGGSGVFINLDGTGGFNDTYVCEIPPKGSLKPIKHIYEETVFILKGQGATTVWIDENHKQTFEWRQNSYFAIPPNAWYQHHNVSGTESALRG